MSSLSDCSCLEGNQTVDVRSIDFTRWSKTWKASLCITHPFGKDQVKGERPRTWSKRLDQSISLAVPSCHLFRVNPTARNDFHDLRRMTWCKLPHFCPANLRHPTMGVHPFRSGDPPLVASPTSSPGPAVAVPTSCDVRHSKSANKKGYTIITQLLEKQKSMGWKSCSWG